MTKPAGDTAEAAIDGSVAVATIENAFAGSELVRTIRRVFSALTGASGSKPWRVAATWTTGSVAARSTRRISATVATAWTSSTVTQVARILLQWTTSSRLFRWLTTEPEPEVIVIDLGETWTVGPVIALLDRTANVIRPVWRGSTLKRVVIGTGEYIIEAPIRALSIAVVVATITNLAVGTALAQLDTTEFWILLLVLLLAAFGLRSTTSWEELVESRPGRFLLATLEPPEPPDGDGRPRSDGDRETESDGTEE